MVFRAAFGEAARIESLLLQKLSPAEKARRVGLPIPDRLADRAAGLRFVLAISEAALGRQRLQVLEDVGDARGGVGHLQFPHAGGVQNDAASGHQMKLAARRRMPPSGVAFPDGLRCNGLVSGERVGQRGFPHARGPEERDSPARLAPLRQRLERLIAARVEGNHLDPVRDRTGRVNIGLRVCHHVGFRQDDDRCDLRLEREHDVALQPRDVEVLVAGRDDEGGVDIRSNQLPPPLGAGCAALDDASPGQQATGRRLRAVQEQPVADGHISARWNEVVDAVAEDMQAAAMHRDDAHRRRFGQRLDIDLLCEEGTPSECLKRRRTATRLSGFCAAGKGCGVVNGHGSGSLPERKIVPRREAAGGGFRRRQLRVDQGLVQPAIRVVQLEARQRQGFGDRRETSVGIVARIALGRGTIIDAGIS